MMPNSTAVRPAIESTAPTGSSGVPSGSRESGTRNQPAVRATATTGRFTRKTAPHSKCSSRKPPATGPMPRPSPATAAQTPIAFARSRAGKTFVAIDSVVGMMNAPPTPMSARLAISISALLAIAAISEPAPNTTRPVKRARRRPKRSPSAPAVRRVPAKTRR
jgi:hypothetical protein